MKDLTLTWNFAAQDSVRCQFCTVILIKKDRDWTRSRRYVGVFVTATHLEQHGVFTPSAVCYCVRRVLLMCDKSKLSHVGLLQPPEVKEAQPAEQSHWARNLKIGAAAVAGGTILAVTGAFCARCAVLCCAVLCCAVLCCSTASHVVLWHAVPCCALLSCYAAVDWAVKAHD